MSKNDRNDRRDFQGSGPQPPRPQLSSGPPPRVSDNIPPRSATPVVEKPETVEAPVSAPVMPAIVTPPAPPSVPTVNAGLAGTRPALAPSPKKAEFAVASMAEAIKVFGNIGSSVTIQDVHQIAVQRADTDYTKIRASLHWFQQHANDNNGQVSFRSKKSGRIELPPLGTELSRVFMLRFKQFIAQNQSFVIAVHHNVFMFKQSTVA